MTDLLVIRSSFTDPRVQEFGAPSHAAPDDDVERTPPRDETKPKENRPSDLVSRTMKAVLSCSPGNPKNQRKTKIRALRWGTQVQHALAGDEIMASKCSSKPGSPIGKLAAGDMLAVSPRLSPRVRRSIQWKKHKDVHIGSNTQEAEEAYAEENRPLLGDKSGKQANVMSPKMRRSKQWQQHKDVHGDVNTQEATETYEEKHGILLSQSSDIDQSCADDDEPNKADSCHSVNLLMDELSPPGDLLEQKDRWTGDKQSWGTQSQHALAGEEILASKCSSKPGSLVGKVAAGDMTAVSPRTSPRVRRSKQWKQRKEVHIGSSTQEAEEANTEESSPLMGDKSGKQADGMSPKMRRSKQWQQHKDVDGDVNTQEATETYEEKHGILLRQSSDIDQLCADDDEPNNKADNCHSMNLLMDELSPPGDLLEQKDRWTGEKRAKLVTSPPTTQFNYYDQLVEPHDEENICDAYDDLEQLNKVHERLALYRIKAHELFWEGKELDIAHLKEYYSADTLRDEGYFERYEMNREWYFKPEYCKRSDLEDYQRLVLRCDVDDTYISWDSYQATCSTLKCDLEFLKFYEEFSSEIKVEDDDVEPTKEHFDAQRRRYDIKAHHEAPKIAARFCNIYAELVHTAITDCTCSAMFDLTYTKDLDRVFFEIWKRIAKDKVDFKVALQDLYKLGSYPLQHRFIKAELEERPLRSITMKDAYYTHMAHVDEKVSEDEVVLLIKDAVNKTFPKPLIYVDYIRKKLEVAKEIGVIP